MSKRSPYSALALAAALTTLAHAAHAAPKPLVMGPLYTEPSRQAANPAPPSANGCAVQVVELTDARRGPETVGSVVGFQQIQAPTDRDAWLRSVIEVGLTARGFKPSFGAEPAPGAVTARVRLRTVWISLVQMNKMGSAVLQASAAQGAGEPGAMKIYRADRTSVNMWGSQSEFNELVNQVFAGALDGLAADLRPLCAAGPSAA